MKLSSNLKIAGRAALQWRVLLIWLGSLLLPTLLLAAPVWSTLSAALDQSLYAPQLARVLDLVAVADILGDLRRNNTALGAGAIAALVLTLLLSPFLTGVVTTAGRAHEPARLRQLFAGGVAEYARMLRMLVWAVVPLGVALAIGGALADAAEKAADEAILEAVADRWSLAATVASVLLVALANLTLDAGRAQLAIDRRRRSAVLAWWRGVKLLLRRPGAMLGCYVLLTLAGLLLAALLVLARLNLPAGNAGWLLLAFLLTQLIVLVLAWMRSARLFALMTLAATNR